MSGEKNQKALVVIILWLAFAAWSAPSAADPYGWTISASSTDPFVNTIPFSLGLHTYYLWLACCDLPAGMQQGLTAAEFSLFSQGGTIFAFTPMNGFVNDGTTLDLRLSVDGCPCGPVVAGSILTHDSTPGIYCIGPTIDGYLRTSHCEMPPTWLPIDWTGLDTGGGACAEGMTCAGPVSVGNGLETNTWGRAKNLYR